MHRLNLALDIRGGIIGLLGKFLHLAGNNGKAFAGLTGPCRLNGRIQGQELGLFGNFNNGLNHRGYLLRGLAQRINLV